MSPTQHACPTEFRYRSRIADRPVNPDSAAVLDDCRGNQAAGLHAGETAWVQQRDGLFHWDGKLWLNGFTCTQSWQDDHFAMQVERVAEGIAVLSWDRETLLGADHGDGDRRGSLPEHKPNMYRSYAHDLWVVTTPDD